MPNARAYLLLVALGTASILAAVAAANLWVDPFGIVQLASVPGVNAEKAGQHGHDRMVKAYAIRRLRPDVLLLGTSRVQYGLSPRAPALRSVGERPYNAGLLGGNVYMALRYLQHAQAAGQLGTVVLGLDPLMFDDQNTDAERDFSEDRLLTDAAGRPQLGLSGADLAGCLLSYDALRLSLRTLRRQSTLVTDLLPDGQRSPVALAQFFAEAPSTHAGFAATERTYFRDFARAQLPEAGQPSASMAQLDRILELAAAYHLRLELFFTPEHVRLWEVARQAGRAEAVADWRRQVAQRVARVQRLPGEPQVRLWNMALVDALSEEPVPPPTAGQAPMRFFWEATHVREEVGHRMLARMLGGALPPEGYGEPTDPDRLERQILEAREALAAWGLAHPDEVADVASHRRDRALNAP